MKAENPYTGPSPKQVKALCSVVSKAAPLPDAELTQYWIDKPAALACRLSILNYRPAVFLPSTVHTNYTVVNNLANDGLAFTGGSNHLPARSGADVAVLDAFTEPAVARAREIAESGVVVVLKTIPEDLPLYQDLPNIFPYAGDQHDSMQLERFVRDVLFQIRDRFYCGEMQS